MRLREASRQDGVPSGWMAIFDDDASKSWDEKIYTRDEIVAGKTIHYIGL